MDLKEFIKETISGIVEASKELQAEFEKDGVILNPPVSAKYPELYAHEDTDHLHRRVELIEFDVAVTAGSDSSGGGKAGLKVLSFEAGVDANHTQRNERASRVRFSIPLVLSPASIEEANKNAARLESERNQRIIEHRSRNRGKDGWMK